MAHIQIFWPEPEEIENRGRRYVGVSAESGEVIDNLLKDPGNRPPNNCFSFDLNDNEPEGEEKLFVCFWEGTPAYKVFDTLRAEGKQIYQDEQGRQHRMN